MPGDQDETEQLLLRALRPGDREFFRDLAQDERVTRYVGDGAPWADDYVQQRFDHALDGGDTSEREVHWFIAETSAGARMGLLALTMRPAETEIGYWVAPGRWGNGYGTRMLDRALTLARGSRPRLPLVATVHRDNLASRHMVERAGFVTTNSDGAPASMYIEYRSAPLVTDDGT